MYVAYISPLNLKVCISRLERVRELEETSLSFEYDPVKCEVSGKNFTLKKRRIPWIPYIHGELSETPDGTVITYSMQTDPFTGRFQKTWLLILIPFLSCFVIGLISNMLEHGITLKMSLAVVGALSIPIMFYLRNQFADKQAEHDKKEMLDFLQKLLDARPKLP
jgi:hypothetical protein